MSIGNLITFATMFAEDILFNMVQSSNVIKNKMNLISIKYDNIFVISEELISLVLTIDIRNITNFTSEIV